MVRYYNELTRLEMEQVDKDETVVMIPVGALEQHGNQCPLGTDEIIAEGTARRIKEALDREIPDYPNRPQPSSQSVTGYGYPS